MPVMRIQRPEDPRLHDYRNVRDPELLRRRRQFVAEGRVVVGRLLESGYRVVSLLLSEQSLASLQDRLGRIPDLPVYVASTDALESIVGFNLHRGCLALAECPPSRDPIEVAAGADLLLVLEGVTDPDNVGSAFRNAAAFGAGGVLLSPTCCDPLYRKAVRTSMGSILRVPYARVENWPWALAALKAEGFVLVALTPKDHAIDLSACARQQPRQKMALLVGTEGPGLTADAESMVDVCVRIPTRPEIDSLNLATATGIALYYLTNPQSLVP